MKSKIFAKIWHDEMSSAGQWDNGQGTIDFVLGNQKDSTVTSSLSGSSVFTLPYLVVGCCVSN